MSKNVAIFSYKAYKLSWVKVGRERDEAEAVRGAKQGAASPVLAADHERAHSPSSPPARRLFCFGLPAFPSDHRCPPHTCPAEILESNSSGAITFRKKQARQTSRRKTL
ncbi:hypothetical protein GN956_G19681 [Arapaima gigas]